MVQKTTRPERRPPTTVPTGRTAHDTELVDHLDELLDEIDALLEDNAQEFLKRYRQRGGE